MILGSCTGRLSLPTLAGIPCPGFFGAASAFPLVLDLVSASSEDLAGAGATGGTTGTAVDHSTTITLTSRTAETSVTRDSITVIPATVTSPPTAAIVAADSTGLRVFTEVPAFTGSQERTPAGSVAAALIMAETFEGFRRAVGRALAVVATEAAATAVVDGTR